ncbi:uncharacterized protein LOC114253545 [Bombyx mandarina]|uniref:Uncharacterized protein LOC114253545 n=1 Tax=Bombyx mandarina TaxID=7092 RepID=A0A6J2KQ78_BOMMA|nr:uncharacterized protein LOC114253545 [Bombyx mandarina]
MLTSASNEEHRSTWLRGWKRRGWKRAVTMRRNSVHRQPRLLRQDYPTRKNTTSPFNRCRTSLQCRGASGSPFTLDKLQRGGPTTWSNWLVGTGCGRQETEENEVHRPTLSITWIRVVEEKPSWVDSTCYSCYFC